MSGKKLAVVGSANVDLVFESPRFPAPGETVIGSSFRIFSGGKGANQAVAAARLGAEVEFVGKIGSDEFSRLIRSSLAEAGVSCDQVLTAETASTGTAGIVVAATGENTIVTNPGANSHLYADEVENALEKIGPALILTQLEIPAETVRACAGRSRLQLNPAPAAPLNSELLTHIEILTPNRNEAEALTGISPTDDGQCYLCASALLDAGVKKVVITLGERGSFVATHSFAQLVPTLAVKPVDTTGAGDTFNGALATFLLEDRDLLNAVVLANAAAAISTTRWGAQASMPTREELRSFFSDEL